jgi:hypothetical protein
VENKAAICTKGAQGDASLGSRIGPTYSYPPPPGVVRIDIKQKDLQIGMLEVIENKGANLRLKSVLMRLVDVEE